MSVKKKPSRWMRPHHRLVQTVLSAVLSPYTRWKYNIEVVPFREETDRPVLILINHQTAWDQFFVAMAFRKPIYFIASEDIFSLGWVSKLISFLAAPIPIKKQTSDLRAVRTAMQAAKEGGSIALAPEGNRTFSGQLCYIKPSVLGLIRILKLPVVTFRIEGGYGVHPRWSDVIRKGPMKAYPSRVIEPEEYKVLNDAELMDILLSELNVDEACISGQFHSPQLAEYLERVVYVCPECGLSVFESHGDIIKCRKCGLAVRYLPDKTLQHAAGSGRNSGEFPFHFLADWYHYQCGYIRNLDLAPYYDTPAYEDQGRLSEVILYDRKKVLTENGHLKLFGNRIEVCSEDFAACWTFDEVDTVTVLGKNKINLYTGGKVYQIKPDKRFNALKYVNIFYQYKALAKGENDGKQFLGL